MDKDLDIEKDMNQELGKDQKLDKYWEMDRDLDSERDMNWELGRDLELDRKDKNLEKDKDLLGWSEVHKEKNVDQEANKAKLVDSQEKDKANLKKS